MGLACLLVLTQCDKLKELQDPDFKYAEPYFSKWNLTVVKAYELYVPGGNPDNKQTANEREYTEVAGWIEFTKDKDSDDSYYRGSFSVTYGAVDYLGNEYEPKTYEGQFKWDPDEDKNIYIEMDSKDQKVLGVGYNVVFMFPDVLTESDMTLRYSDGGYNDEYNVVEFVFKK